VQNVSRTGSVDWTGDNPFMYLKTDPEADDWSSLSLSFTVRSSAYGTGRLMMVVDTPYEEPGRRTIRLAITDNAALAEHLIANFVRRFRPFRAAVGLDRLSAVDGAVFTTTSPGDTWTDRGEAPDGRSIEMRWTDLQPPIAVDVPAEASGTGAHDMFSVFRMTTQAQVLVDGRQLPGAPVPFTFHHLVAPSAAVAVSETWLLQ
jgi:hypothetical protein